MGDDQPISAVILSALGGMLILIEGLFIGSLASAVTTAGSPVGGQVIGTIGLIGDFFGVVILLLAVGLYRAPDLNVGLGIALIILGLLSFFGGGGFVLGLILTVIGGILAIIWKGEEDDTPLPDMSYGYSRPAPQAHIAPGAVTAWPAAATSAKPVAPAPLLGAPPPTLAGSSGKTCPSCHTAFETSRLYCPQCGAFVP